MRIILIALGLLMLAGCVVEPYGGGGYYGGRGGGEHHEHGWR